MSKQTITKVIEAILLAANEPLCANKIHALFDFSDSDLHPTKAEVMKALDDIAQQYSQHSAAELIKVASGFRIQIKAQYTPWLMNMFSEKTPRYSRAMLETLAIIAYRQPVTRAEIEEIRGVAVSSQIIRNLEEREWIKVLGHKDVPGKPAMLGTCKQFLDYFNLQSLSELPNLLELSDLEKYHPELDLKHADETPSTPAG